MHGIILGFRDQAFGTANIGRIQGLAKVADALLGLLALAAQPVLLLAAQLALWIS
jgi:hypothetical protein